ncbi:putative ABC transporter [Lyophyllum shimeji]|uniref:ABC transporter n=1 Tax=Lyophyllum shimeji TaxID=47721 RepID=A0A9P3PZP9_LYOSH|nr:putative ABC transporter [Lyophyllum shimeji]
MKTVGIWQVLTLKESFSIKPSRWVEWNKYISTLPHIRRLVGDIYALNPPLVILYLASRAWKGVVPGITVYVSSQLFVALEAYLRDGEGDPSAVLQALMAHLFCVVISTLTSSLHNHFVPKLTSQTQMFFEEHLIRENLRYDVQTLQQSKTQRPSAYMGWHCFAEICEACSNIMALFTVVTSIMIYQQHGGSFFTTLCLIYPLLARTMRSSWMKAVVWFSDNDDYIRMQAIHLLSAPWYREDIAINNLSEHLMKEYTKARKRLATDFTEHPLDQLRADNQTIFQLFYALSGEIPLMYFAYCAMVDPFTNTMSTLAILQKQSSALSGSIDTIFYMLSSVLYTLENIKSLYHMEELKLVDGTVEYLPPEGSTGMSFELQNVSFAYPGAKSKEGALKEVSLQIKAGQLVVIVGENGSGKSTFIKLLTRTYDVTSGQLLVNGIPIQDYKIADLHDATAILHQDHMMYPLSLAENIGLGYPACVADTEMIKESAVKGGASEVIAGLGQGLDTVLEPVQTASGCHLEESKYKELKDVLESLEVTTEVSGGEKQRVVASRTFMRLRSPRINFIAVDEPSSALDPRGELELFDRLRSEQGGRTMIFVTHRFGHLTKHADLIICMKNGQIVESGVHKDLLALNGEYATLYNIQAQAFAPAQGTDRAGGFRTPPDNDAFSESDRASL